MYIVYNTKLVASNLMLLLSLHVQTMQTSFVENGCDACTGNVVDGAGGGPGAAGGASNYTAINTNNLTCPTTGSNNSTEAILSNRRCSGINNKRNNKQ